MITEYENNYQLHDPVYYENMLVTELDIVQNAMKVFAMEAVE